VEIEVPRARLNTADGKTTEWKSKALRAYQRRTLVADALIAGAYLAGTNTRRVRRALASLFGGAVGKDTPHANTMQADFSNKAPGERKQRSPLRARCIVLCVTRARIDNLNHRSPRNDVRRRPYRSARNIVRFSAARFPAASVHLTACMNAAEVQPQRICYGRRTPKKTVHHTFNPRVDTRPVLLTRYRILVDADGATLVDVFDIRNAGPQTARHNLTACRPHRRCGNIGRPDTVVDGLTHARRGTHRFFRRGLRSRWENARG
jgi:hypothetical protein